MSTTAKPCGYCKRSDGTHSDRCHTLRRSERCALCKKLAPEKCHWHGGPSHSTSGANKKALRARRKAPPAMTAGLSGYPVVPKSVGTASPPNGRATAARGGNQVKAPNGSALTAARVAITAEIAATKTRLAKLEAAHAGLVELGA